MVYRGKAAGFRIALIAFAALAVFVASSALLLMVLPSPHTRAHYLLAGTAPTVIGLLAALVRTQRDRGKVRSLPVRRVRAEGS